MPRPTLQSIADTVGVSRMTVSNAFSRPDQLSSELRDRILAVAAEVGYHGPDPAARSLATGTSGTIGVLWTQSLRLALSDPVTAGFLGALADELSADGLALTLLPPNVPAHDVAMDAAVAYSSPPDSEAMQWLRGRGVPMVGVDMPWPDGPQVAIDDRGGARAAAELLIELGHRRVLVLAQAGELQNEWPLDERVTGWLEGLGSVTPVVGRVQAFGDNQAVIVDLLRRAAPTAVLCVTDLVAAQAVAAASELGLDVPGQLSVIGFDDHPVAAGLGLTTVRQNVVAKGRAAAHLVRQLLARAGEGGAGTDADPSRPADVLLPVELVVRQSTGPAPAETARTS